MPRGRDTRTLDLFEVPEAPEPMPGSLGCGVELRHLLSEILKRCHRSRYEVAARMSELLGAEVSKYQLDSWTAESRNDWRFPLEYAAAFEAATDSHGILQWLAQKRGCEVVVGEDTLLTELGRIERAEQELKKRKRALKSRLNHGGK